MPVIERLQAEDFIELEDRFGAHNYQPLDVVIQRAEGVWVYDVEGFRYLDCLASYSAVNQGHCHPRILKALLEQAYKVTLTSRAFRNDQLPLLYQQLNELTGFEMALPMNSGAEAVETAIKAARKWGYTVKGIPAGQSRNHCLRQQLSRTHRYRHQLLQRRAVSRRLRAVHAGIQDHSLRRCRRPCATPLRPTPAPSWLSRSRAKPEL